MPNVVAHMLYESITRTNKMPNVVAHMLYEIISRTKKKQLCVEALIVIAYRPC